jgi:uncharacterized protein with HEPN domain
MCDIALIREVLAQIIEASNRIKWRFTPIKKVDDFLDSPEGLEKLDSICMMLIAIGESLKNLDKLTDGKLLARYPNVDWKGAKGVRDIISHHYFDLDAELIFGICKNDMKGLQETVTKMLHEFKQAEGKGL